MNNRIESGTGLEGLHESGTTVSPDYTTDSSRFTGKIRWVQLDLGDDDHDHYIDPEERLRVAMSRQ